MGLLDESMAIDARYGFMDTDAFAEAITYKPIGGSAQSINAIVEREIPDDIVLPEIKGPTMIINVAKSATTSIGVSAVSINDEVTLPRQPGGSTVTVYVQQIIEQDTQAWRLLVH
jgi:hypothetical protein